MGICIVNDKLVIYAPDIHAGDAVGNHCLGVYRLAERLGLRPVIAAQRFSFDESLYSSVKIDDLFSSELGDAILYISYSIYDSLLEKVIKLDNKKICYFHNVTTPDLLEEFEPVTASLCRKSYTQFNKLRHFDLIVSNSSFSKGIVEEFVDFSYVIPPLFSDQIDGFINQKTSRPTVQSDLNSVTYLGRIVPHKKIEDIITIVSNYNSLYEDKIILNIVGNSTNEKYAQFLLNKVKELGNENYIVFHGGVNQTCLYQILSSSISLITASEHEGFCIPVLEAMAMKLPVLAKKGTAADELLPEVNLSYSSLDEAVQLLHKIRMDIGFRNQLVQCAFDNVEPVIEKASDKHWQEILKIVKQGSAN